MDREYYIPKIVYTTYICSLSSASWFLITILVECDITDLSINKSTTSITSKGGTTHTYVYQEVLPYDCYYGYKKTNMDVIQCQHDETWSSTPECTQTGDFLSSSQI